MQIHELDNYSGSLNSGAFVAVDNGNDTGKVSAEQFFAPLNARIDNIIAGGDAPSAAEVTDARLGADSVVYPSLGDAIRSQVSDLEGDINSIENVLNMNNLFNARLFTSSNADNWTIISKSKTALSAEKLRNFAAGSPRAPLNLPSGDYVFHADFTYSGIMNFMSLYVNGSSSLLLYDGTNFTIDDNNTNEIVFTANALGVYTITDIAIKDAALDQNVIEEQNEKIDQLENDFDAYVKANATPKKQVITFTSEAGYVINPTTGAVSAAGDTPWVVSDPISVTPGDKYYYSGVMRFNNAVVAFYDSGDVFISAIAATSGTEIETNKYQFTDYEFVVPDNVETMRLGYITGHGRSVYTCELFKNIGYSLLAIDKPWAGLKWTAVGDSLTEVNAKTTKNYCDYISEVTGIGVVNMGLSGSGYMRKHDTNQAFYNRVANVPTDSDVVTIFGSLNDIGGGQTLGTINDTVANGTVFGYVNGTLDALYAAYPTVNIGIISPTPWKDSEPWDPTESSSKYCEGLRQICYNRGIPFLDLYHCSNLRPWDATARDLFYSKDVVGGVNAGCHPDEAGHKMFAPKIKNFIESLLL